MAFILRRRSGDGMSFPIRKVSSDLAALHSIDQHNQRKQKISASPVLIVQAHYL